MEDGEEEKEEEDVEEEVGEEEVEEEDGEEMGEEEEESNGLQVPRDCSQTLHRALTNQTSKDRHRALPLPHQCYTHRPLITLATPTHITEEHWPLITKHWVVPLPRQCYIHRPLISLATPTHIT